MGWGSTARALGAVRKSCGCHHRERARLTGELTPAAEEYATARCAAWGCGTASAGRTPAHDALAARVAELQGLSRPPTGCPFAPLYRHAPPVVVRATQALALMEDGLPASEAFPGGVTAVDHHALVILRRGRTARQRSDDALDALERERAEAARKAAEK